MHRTTFFLSLLAAAAPALADDLPGSTAPSGKEARAGEELRLRAVAGAFDGVGVRRASGPVALFQADWAPHLRTGDWEVAFPLGLEHRQTFGKHLDETTASAAVDASYAAGSLRLGPMAGYGYTWRPGWPDLYQPDGAGGLLPTDRYSHSHLFVGGQGWWKLGGGRHLRLKARYLRDAYVHDPNYDPTVSIVHLAPRDHHEVRLDASYRQLIGRFAWAVRLAAFDRKYDELYARRADTGGTSRSNGLQELRGFEPRGEVQFRSRPFDLTVGAGVPLQSDPFEGYYSYAGFRPFAEVKGALTHRLSYGAKASAKLLTYGPNSKSLTSAGGGVYVPGTEDGKRLWYRTWGLEAGLRCRLAGGFAIVANGEWTRRLTNFRDYVPGVYPPPIVRPYDTDYSIRWDYTNWMITGGLEWSPSAKAERSEGS